MPEISHTVLIAASLHRPGQLTAGEQISSRFKDIYLCFTIDTRLGHMGFSLYLLGQASYVTHRSISIMPSVQE